MRKRHFNHVIGKRLHLRISFGDHRHNLAFAGFHFLDVAHYLFVGTVLSSDKNHRHLLVNQGDWSVLHFCCWIPFCMDVGDLLQLQGSFQGHWEIVSSAQIQHVARVLVLSCNFLYESIGLQRLFYLGRDGGKLVKQLNVGAFRKRSPLVAQLQGHHGQYGNLSREGLRRGHTDLWASMGVRSRMGGTRNGRTHHIAYPKNGGSTGLGQFNGSKRIGCLPRLGDRNHKIFFVDDGITVSKLRGILHLHRNPCKLLK